MSNDPTNDLSARDEAPTPAAAEPAKPKRESKKERIASLEKQVAECQDKYLRVRADYDNYRKRSQRDIEAARLTGKITTLEDLLPVLDHFQMAMAHAAATPDVATLKQGMDMILAEFERAFQNIGVVTIPSVGQPFDPNLHEAISAQPSAEVPEGHVMSEYKAGYRIGDRVLRASSVIVSSGPAEDAAQAPSEP